MKKKQSVCALLPEELIEEILVRLPVQSVVRFKCVCKSWLSLFSNPRFSQLHFDLAAAPSNRLLLQVTGNHIQSIDTDSSLRFYQHLRIPPPLTPSHCCCPLQLFGSCRGFLLLNRQRDEYDLSNLIVWNPSTGVHKRIPAVGGMDDYYEFLCGFGYDKSKDDYLVIVIAFIVLVAHQSIKMQATINLFSLKTYSWDCNYLNNIGCSYLPFKNIAGFFLNGALHWFVFADNCVVIIAFNLVDRRLSEIPLPPVLNDRTKYWLRGLRVIGGCLGVWCINHEIGLRREMWTMKEYGVFSSWSRSFVFGDGGPPPEFSPICLTKDNALLGSVIRSDIFRASLHKLCGQTDQWLSQCFTYGKVGDFYNLPYALYRESLLSLPNDFEETTLKMSKTQGIPF